MPPVNRPIKNWSPFYCLLSGKLCLKLKVDVLLFFLIPLFSDWSHLSIPQRLLSQDVRNHIHYLKVSPNSRNSDREYFLIASCTELSHACQHAFPFLSINNLTWEQSSITSTFLCLSSSLWFLHKISCQAHYHNLTLHFFPLHCCLFPSKPNLHLNFFLLNPGRSGSNAKNKMAIFSFSILPLHGQFLHEYNTQLQTHILLPTVRCVQKIAQAD